MNHYLLEQTEVPFVLRYILITTTNHVNRQRIDSYRIICNSPKLIAKYQIG